MNRRRQAGARQRTTADDGFSLAELMVASTIGLLALTVVSTAFVMVVRQQESVVDGSHQLADAQVAVADLRRAVRNAASVQVSADGMGLVARTRAADGTAWVCRAWRWSADPATADGVLYTAIGAEGTSLTDVAGAATDPAGIVPSGPTVDPAGAAGWWPAVDAVEPGDPTVPGARVFAVAPHGVVEVDLTVRPRSPQGSATRLSTAVLPLPQDEDHSGGCF